MLRAAVRAARLTQNIRFAARAATLTRTRLYPVLLVSDAALSIRRLTRGYPIQRCRD